MRCSPALFLINNWRTDRLGAKNGRRAPQIEKKLLNLRRQIKALTDQPIKLYTQDD